MRDLLRTPRHHPSAIFAIRLVPPLPRPCRRALNGSPVRARNLPREALLDILTQPGVRHQLRDLRTTSSQISLPLRDRGSVVELAASGRSVAAQLPRDRPWVASHDPRDCPHPFALHTQQSDLLPLAEGQITARRRARIERAHTATLTEPPRRDRGRHADRPRRLLRKKPLGDSIPERDLDRTLILRMPRRAQLRPHRPIGSLLTTNHPTPPHQGVATTS